MEPVTQQAWTWIVDNRKRVFSGIGTAILIYLISQSGGERGGAERCSGRRGERSGVDEGGERAISACFCGALLYNGAYRRQWRKGALHG